MRYLVTAKVKPGREAALLDAIRQGTLGRGSVAAGEYLRNMRSARIRHDGAVKWVEVCFCEIPLDEERPYWEEYFELLRVQDAHHRDRCKDVTGQDPWACSTCDCSQKLEAHLQTSGPPFLELLTDLAEPSNPRDGTDAPGTSD
jgi:hypothetical protein